MMMKMYFNTQLHFKFLFQNWSVDTSTVLFATCVAAIFLAVFLEATKRIKVVVCDYYYSLPLEKASTDAVLTNRDDVVTETTTADLKITDSLDFVKSQRVKNHVMQTIIHATRVTFGYFLMLAVMTYNTWIMIAVVGGSVLGYFLFCYGSVEGRLIGAASPTSRTSTIVSSEATQITGDDSTEALLDRRV